MIELEQIVEAMRQPAFYPHRPPRVEMEQTHISYVFLAGDEVYKIKKPVLFSFLDFSTLERRHLLCREEVRLNQRLAPDTYLGVVSLCDDDGRLCLGDEDDGRAIDYAVHMRRLPHQRLLDRLLDDGTASPAMIEKVAIRLAAFHAQAAGGAEITANGSTAAIASILQDNYDNGRRFRGSTVAAVDDDMIQDFSRSFLDRNHDLFARRQGEGRIRECHGDLHSEHICLTDPLVIFDCIEFSTRFRFIDVASDLAFLAMDLDYHGRSDLSAVLVDRYEECSGDSELRRLIPFYACYRAYVRGKVDSIKGTEDGVPRAEQQDALDSARRHFALSYRYTWAYTPALVVMCGLSGSGKSVLAAELAVRTGFLHVSSDIIRKQLAGLAPTARAGGDHDTGIYSRDFSERTYTAMLDVARRQIESGRGVILDATFQLRRGRDAVRSLAARAATPLLFVECSCSPEEAERRIRQRAERDDNPSDADAQVYRRQRQRYQPFAIDDPDLLAIDTTGDSPSAVRVVEAALRRRLVDKMGSTAG